MKSFNHFASLIIPVLIILFESVSFAQNVPGTFDENTFSGIITDSETGNPIPNVEVFISGTSIGCTTNNNGEYELHYMYLPVTLIAHHVSYNSFIKKIDSVTGKINIRLKPDVKPISEVKIAGKNNRKNNIRFFESRFIPNFKNKIKILNDSVLIFHRTETEFTAYSKEPLIIMNYLLGYKIKLLLKEFCIYKANRFNSPRLNLNSNEGNEMMLITGYFYFDTIPTYSDKIKTLYEKNRLLHYFGSYRHFLKAVYDQELQKQGYIIEVYPDDIKSNGFKQVNNLPDANKDSKYYIIEGEFLTVNFHTDKKGYPTTTNNLQSKYHHKVSYIYPGKGIVEIRSNGISPDFNFLIAGPMSPANNPANSFPEDYLPPVIM
ncbi:MAG: carboxypeptidase-like regulatory domain-containing protein, partial [Prolixibacteraceae bacterium]|nr:carboxypeptidase-like regulatory domain-containing protein [Prolixibacteraceae bacterium]MBN2773312.1 carboxypeptidase-like regulatory domain-containing protein [Prolixibacteraceae bacterium]